MTLDRVVETKDGIPVSSRIATLIAARPATNAGYQA
jgi:hypothetical protein